MAATAAPATTMPTCSTVHEVRSIAAPTCFDHFHPADRSRGRCYFAHVDQLDFPQLKLAHFIRLVEALEDDVEPTCSRLGSIEQAGICLSRRRSGGSPSRAKERSTSGGSRSSLASGSPQIVSVTTSSLSSDARRRTKPTAHAVGAVSDHFDGALLLERGRRVASVPPQSTLPLRRSGCRRASTSPTTFITSDSPARSRRLSTIASGELLRRLARLRARTAPTLGLRRRSEVAVGKARLDVGGDYR